MNEVVQIQLVRRAATKQKIIDAAMNHRPFLPPDTRIEHSMESLARVFNPVNLNLLTQLRALGHVSLDTAAKRLGYEDAMAFVRDTMDGLNLYLDFRPTSDGEPGVCVAFDKLLIDLDIEPVA